jgi:hypothetical protein
LDFALFNGVSGSYNNAGRIEFTMPCLLLQELKGGLLVRSPYATAQPQIIGLSGIVPVLWEDKIKRQE